MALVKRGGENEAYKKYKILGSFTPKSSFLFKVLSVEEGLQKLNELISQGYTHGYDIGRKQLQCFELTTIVTYQYKWPLKYFISHPNYDMSWYLRQLLSNK